MNYRCPSSDCAGSAAPLPEAMAQAYGMKCPVCQAELKEDAEAPIEVQKDSAGGPWTDWPTPVSLPLCEYFEEEHPGAKLWAACDAFEMLTRLLVIVLVGSRTKGGELEDGLRGRLSRLIESPTFGAWYVMARDLAEAKGGSEDLSAGREFVLGPLRDLLYGPDNPGTDETSFLKLRNRLAHGGGMTRKEQSRLLDVWKGRVEETIDQLEWMSGWELLGKSEDGEWKKLTGKQQETIHTPDGVEDGESDSVWLRVNDSLYPLWPLAAFGRASIQAEGKEKTSKDEAPQVYSRKESVRLGYVPLGVDGMGHAESSVGALAAFEHMFRPSEKAQASGFKIKDFMGEIRKDAGQMVGRQAELEDIITKVRETRQGVLWISGQAGMGKSFLMAKLSVDLLDEFSESGPLVLSYRMRAGDQDRCGRESLAQFVFERLATENMIPAELVEKLKRKKDDSENDEKETLSLKDPGEKSLGHCFEGLRKDASVVLVVDGLDEVTRRDEKFAEEIPLSLLSPRVLWVCSGRPEPAIVEPMRKFGAEDLFPDGLLPMREEDVRGMILEKIGPLRKKLLGKDDEQDGKVINPFIRLVTERAAGLPLYVKYVIGDVLGGKYRVLDGEEELPDSLHAYHEELLRRLSVGDLQAVVTPLAATLATAYEPLSVRELSAILVCRKLLVEKGARQMVDKGLAAIASMVRSAPDSEGEVGYCLYHQSLRDHMLGSELMTHSISTARETFADLAEAIMEQPPALRNYLSRCEIDHLLDVGRKLAAERLLLNLDYLHWMMTSKVDLLKQYGYWEKLGGEKRAMQYLERIDEALSGCDDEKLFVSELSRRWADDKVGDFIAKATRKSSRLHRASFDLEKGFEKALATGKADHDFMDFAAEAISTPPKLLKAFSDEKIPDFFRYAEEFKFSKLELRKVRLITRLARGNIWQKLSYSITERIHEFKIRKYGSGHPAISASLDEWAQEHSKNGDFEKAEELHSKALEIRLEKHGAQHIAVAHSYERLGWVHLYQKKYDLAIELHGKALDIRMEHERGNGRRKGMFLQSYDALGESHKEYGNYDQAIKFFQKSLTYNLEKSKERGRGPSLAVARSYMNLASVYLASSDFREAIGLYEECLGIYFERLDSDNPILAKVFHSLGTAFSEMKNHDRAIEFFGKSLEICMVRFVPVHPFFPRIYKSFGTAYFNKGDYGEAVSFYRKSLGMVLVKAGSTHPQVAKTYKILALCFTEKGDSSQSNECEAMAKWSQVRAEGRFLDEIDPVEFEKEVGISHERAKEIEEDIINSK